jgi:hypothetical protein
MTQAPHRQVHEQLVEWAESTRPLPSPELARFLGPLRPMPVTVRPPWGAAVRTGLGLKVMVLLGGLAITSAAAFGVGQVALREPEPPGRVIVPVDGSGGSPSSTVAPSGRSGGEGSSTPTPSASPTATTGHRPATAPQPRPHVSHAPKPSPSGHRPAPSPEPRDPSTEPSDPSSDSHTAEPADVASSAIG